MNLADRGDALDWARRVLRRMESGCAVPPAAQTMALSALRLQRSQLTVPVVVRSPRSRNPARQVAGKGTTTEQPELPL